MAATFVVVVYQLPLIGFALHLMTTLEMSLQAAHYLNVTANECALLAVGAATQTHTQAHTGAHK